VKTWHLGLITLSTFILVSCGGSSSSPTTPTPTPTTPTAPATSVSATVSIPVGATSLGAGAYVPSPVITARNVNPKQMNATHANGIHGRSRKSGRRAKTCAVANAMIGKMPYA